MKNHPKTCYSNHELIRGAQNPLDEKICGIMVLK